MLQSFFRRGKRVLLESSSSSLKDGRDIRTAMARSLSSKPIIPGSNFIRKLLNPEMDLELDDEFKPEDEFSDDEFGEYSGSKERYPKIDTLGRSHGVGRRKTAVARVWIKPGNGSFLINRSPLHERFTRDKLQDDILEPMYVTGSLGHFDVEAFVRGGGFSGQAGALRHGLARALDNYQPSLRKTLRICGMMTRDPRMVERKKPGQPKARKKKQWVKR